MKGKREDLHDQIDLGRVRLNREDISRTAATQGDPLRAVSTLPGVNTQNDISVRPFIRGGKAEETRVFLDGLLLLQPYHFSGAYSPFNPELIERLDLYRSFAPANQRDALSGSLAVKTREPKRFEALGDLSLARANAVAAFPLPGKLTGYLGWHSFFYDQTYKGALALLDLFVDEEGFEEYRNDVQSAVDLPSFRDFQAGLFWRPTDGIVVHWNSIFSGDRYTQYQRAWSYRQGAREVSPTFYDWALMYNNHDLSKHQGFDTLSLVKVDNAVHALTAEWTVSPRLKVRSALAWQNQDWSIAFYDQKIWDDAMDDEGQYRGGYHRKPSDLLIDVERSVLQMRFEGEWTPGENHRVIFGADRETWIDRYHTHVPRPYYELMVNGNSDLLDGLSYLSPSGILVTRADYPQAYWRVRPVDLVLTQRFDYRGRREPAYGALYLSDRWDASAKLKVEAGVRLEHAETPNHWLPTPRVAVHRRLTDRDELSLGLGLYAQSDLPFYALHQNEALKPEKAWQGSWSLTHDFGKSVQFQIEHWYKYYFDLVAGDLADLPDIDWQNADIDSIAYKNLPLKQRQLVRTLYGQKRFVYGNSGRGEAQGLELSVSYRPNPIWTGWFSGEQSVSRRQDHRDEVWYNYRYHRPWALNWVNWWHFPSDYALGLRLRYAAGQPYTPYSNSLNLDDGEDIIGRGQHLPLDGGSSPSPQDTLFYFGRRNSARYAPYMRFDIRISHESKLWGHPFESYFEVWNAFNEPNFLLRDSETGEFKYPELNYPIPVLFFGARWKY